MAFVPGCLVLVVGPSGAGKDSLIDGARARLAADDRFTFVRRYITRPGDLGGEMHVPLSPGAFAALAERDFFALAWEAHGWHYGISRASVADVAAGRIVVANASRTAIEAARGLVPELRVINVTAPAELLAERLSGRGREDAAQVAGRLTRVVPVEGADVVELVNDRSLEEGIARFEGLLREFAVRRELADANG